MSIRLQSDYAAVLAGLNPEQAKAVSAPRTQAVRVMAGAGTGKTELISRRFVKLVKDMAADNIPRPQDRILVVTFTEDAANDMHRRIHGRLLALGEEGIGPQAWVSTFHSFAGRLLRAHSLEVGLAPGFDVLNTMSQNLLFNRLMKEIKNGEHADTGRVVKEYDLDIPPDVLSLDHLTRIREAFDLDGMDDLLETDRVLDLIRQVKTTGLSPAEFLEKATDQTRHFTERLKTMPVNPDPGGDKRVSVQGYIDDWRDALKSWADPDWNPLAEVLSKNPEATPGKMLDAVKSLKNLYLAPKTFEPLGSPDFAELDRVTDLECAMIRVIAAIYALYQDTLLSRNSCDFDDLINHAIQVLEQAPQLRERYRRQFEAIIVDEFQDSNGSQLRLLQLLMRDTPNITVVGDIKQSIYGFRFAQPENMELVFENHAVETISLRTNYRSLPPILSVVNRVTTLITDDAEQTLVPCPAKAGHADSGAKVAWVNLGTEDGEPVHLQKEREAAFIATEIARLVSEENYRYGDITILVKSHRRAEDVQNVLNARRIPSIRKKNLGFFDEPVIKDATALLRLIRNLHDDVALVRILQRRLNQRQLRGLAEERQRQNISLFNLLGLLTNDTGPAADTHEPFCPELSTFTRNALVSLYDELRDIRRRQSRLNPVQLFNLLAGRIGIILPGTPAWLKVQERNLLRTFEKLLFQFCDSQPLQPTLAEVLEILDNYRQNAKEELPVAEAHVSENAVSIMTLHASKGLDFPVVFVSWTDAESSGGRDDATFVFDPQHEGKNGFGLMIGKYRGAKTLKKDIYDRGWKKVREKAEDLREFYVALTRAEDRLYVCRANKSEDWTDGHYYTGDWLRLLDEAENPEVVPPPDPEISGVLFDPATEASRNREEESPARQQPLALETLPDDPASAVLSFSALHSYKRCPVQYWLKYRCRLPEPPHSQEGAKLGSGIHGLIHKHYMYRGGLDTDLARSVLLDWFPDEPAEDIDRMLTIYRRFLESEYAYPVLAAKNLTLMPEKKIRFPWDVGRRLPKHGSRKTELVIEVDGILDLLLHDPASGAYTLIDFKTNRKLGRELIGAYARQLQLYRHGLQTLWPDINLPDERIFLAHLTPEGVDTMAVNEFVSDPNGIEAMRQDFLALLDLALDDRFPVRPHAVSCREPVVCPYLRVCPESQLK